MPKKISSNFFNSSVAVATSLIVPQLPESATSILHELLRYLGKDFNFTKKASIGLYFTRVGCPEQARKVLRSSFLYLWMGPARVGEAVVQRLRHRHLLPCFLERQTFRPHRPLLHRHHRAPHRPHLLSPPSALHMSI
jgi:hypothetical protein